MKSKRFHNSSHPLTQIIDSIHVARKAAGKPITTGDVTGDVMPRLTVALMWSEFEKLLRARVRARLKARGEMLVDDTTWERKTDVDVTDAEFHVTLRVKDAHIVAVKARYAADVAVGKFLDKQAVRLGRSVTMGEFTDEIDAIYARHGFS